MDFGKHRSHCLLNLLGLTLGITCFLFAGTDQADRKKTFLKRAVG